MANSFYTADQVASVGVALASEGLHLSSVVTRAFEGDFAPGGGNQVLLPVPGALIARDRGIADKSTQIVLDEITESTVPVSLDTHAYSAVSLSEGDLSLELADFSRQVLRPQVDAVVDSVENKVADVLGGVAEDASIAFDAADPVPTFTKLRRALRGKGVDTATSDLVAVVGSNVADALLDADDFTPAQSGSDDALRRADIGQVRGFRVLESGRIGADVIVAYPVHAIALTIKAPAVPQGASFGSVVTERGFQLRYLRDYDVMTTKDRSLVSTFVGARVLPAYRVTRDYASDTASVAEVTGGQVVAVDASTTPV